MSKIINVSFLLLLITGSCVTNAQQSDDIITVASTSRIEKTLSADDMQGRASFTPGLEKAGAFIASEFKAAGLQPLKGAEDYLQKFSMYSSKPISIKGKINGHVVPQADWILVSSQEKVKASEKDGYEVKNIGPDENVFRAAYGLIGDKVFVKTFPVSPEWRDTCSLPKPA